MTLEEFKEFIDEQDALFRKVKDTNQTERERIFARTIKLGEEYGELCDQVLSFVGDQRKDKLEKNDKSELANEFSDVVICAFLLAKAMGIDIMESLPHKIKKIREKHNKQLV